MHSSHPFDFELRLRSTLTLAIALSCSGVGGSLAGCATTSSAESRDGAPAESTDSAPPPANSTSDDVQTGAQNSPNGSEGPVLEWTSVHASFGKLSTSVEIIPDATGVWRCHRERCSYWTANADFKRPEFSLPCAIAPGTQFSASPAGNFVAMTCDNDIYVVAVSTGGDATKLNVNSPVKPLVLIDDDGEVTCSMRNGVRRISPAGEVKSYPLKPPPFSIHPDSPADIDLATGKWLAFSHGAYSKEVAWLATDPPTTVPLGGGAIPNRDRLWVSLMIGGYVELDDDMKQSKTTGRFGGGLAPYGLLMGVTPWGPNGFSVSYEQRAILIDEQFETIHMIAFPPVEIGFFAGEILSDGPGHHLYLLAPSGEVFVMRTPRTKVASPDAVTPPPASSTSPSSTSDSSSTATEDLPPAEPATKTSAPSATPERAFK